MDVSTDPQFLERRDRALHQAAVEYGLQDYYYDCVKPLLTMPKEQWPMCCGGGCEPCSGTLVAVADRTLELVEKQGAEDGQLERQ